MDQATVAIPIMLSAFPRPLADFLIWLFGILIILRVIAAIWNAAIRGPLPILFPSFASALKELLKAIVSATDDPIQHPSLELTKKVSSIVFNSSAFLYFTFIAGIFSIAFLARANDILGLKLFSMVAYIGVAYYFAAVFKAETGRAIIAYREFRSRR